MCVRLRVKGGGWRVAIFRESGGRCNFGVGRARVGQVRNAGCFPPSRSDAMMVAVGFNPRSMNRTPSVRRVATIDNMANTYTSLHYHLVFSTKNRELWIKPDVEQRIWAYLGGVAKQNGMKPLQIGGTDDHVHALLGAPAVLAPAKIAQLIKGRFVSLGSRDPSWYERFRMARRLRCLYGEPIERAVGDCIHSRAARPSSNADLPRGISRAS